MLPRFLRGTNSCRAVEWKSRYHDLPLTRTFLIWLCQRCENKNAWKNSSNLNLSSPPEGHTRQNLDAQHPMRVLYCNTVVNFKKSGRWATVSDLHVRVLKKQVLLDSSGLFKGIVQSLWELLLPRGRFHFHLNKRVYMNNCGRLRTRHVFSNNFCRKVTLGGWLMLAIFVLSRKICSGHLDDILFSDDRVAHSYGVFFERNSSVRDHKNLNIVVKVSRTSRKVMKWCSTHETKIIGSYFFLTQLCHERHKKDTSLLSYNQDTALLCTS